MDARIVEFAEVLRQNGIRVSTAEVNDAVLATSEIGLHRRELLKSALQTTLVKRSMDLETFDRAFELFFSGAAKTLESLDAALLADLEREGLLERDELAMVVASVNRLFNQLSPLAQAALSADRARLAQLFRASMLELDLSRLESTL